MLINLYNLLQGLLVMFVQMNLVKNLKNLLLKSHVMFVAEKKVFINLYNLLLRLHDVFVEKKKVFINLRLAAITFPF